MPFLEVRGTNLNSRTDLVTSLTVGRLPECDIVLPADGVSRRHCQFELCPEGTWQVRDLGSRNGTGVNGKRVALQSLRHGDVVRVGRFELRFVDPEEALRKPGPGGGSERQEPAADDADPLEPIPLEKVPREPKRAAPPRVALPGGAGRRPPASPNTIDVDLNEVVSGGSEEHAEARLQRICDEAPSQAFAARDISLVDMRGQVVHQAASLGGEGADDARESVRLFRLILLTALRTRASDVHVEPRMHNAAIRLRVDGLMVLAAEFPLDLMRRLLGIIKILCQIDTTQKSQVQDGHFSVSIKGRRVDFRVSLTPAMHGQKLVLRVLDTSNAPTRLHELGVLPWMYEKLRTVAARDSGMVLACGPTGSGKTTTLYACLREIDINTRNAITIEDPVEY